jgi:large subunit ribosomal protein L22e
MAIVKAAKGGKKTGGKKSKKVTKVFTINCSHPVEDGIMVIANFEEFLKGHVKVEGKVGNLGKQVSEKINHFS